MWKSQYIPWNGVSFVNSGPLQRASAVGLKRSHFSLTATSNTGSRAVVMECQHGPRRKGNLTKKQLDEIAKGEYKQTCPARIYVKKVRMFPEYRVDPNLDKKTIKAIMDKAFHELKSAPLDSFGQDRYYVQLPSEEAHEFQDETGQRAANAMLLAAESLGIPKQNSLSLEEEQHKYAK